ncbi:conserved hypothetical protein [Arthrobacter sp. 9AX]|nr:conserved hypothetical protein [Arthrobacter sp. 9AX]
MCGACGRTTVADPVLGPVRSMRQHLIVASTVNAVCSGLPGAPKVTALKEGWMMSGPSGGSRQCQTVEELWSAVLGCFTEASVLDRLQRRRQAYVADPANAGLPARAAQPGGVVPEPAATIYS